VLSREYQYSKENIIADIMISQAAIDVKAGMAQSVIKKW